MIEDLNQFKNLALRKSSNFIGLTFKFYYWLREQSLFRIESRSASLLKTKNGELRKNIRSSRKGLKVSIFKSFYMKYKII